MKTLERIDSVMWLPMVLIIPFSLLVALFIIQGQFVIASALCALCLLIFVVRYIEPMFLLWLLVSPILMSDSFAMVVIHDHPIVTFDRIFIFMITSVMVIQFFFKTRTFMPLTKLEKLLFLLLLLLVASIILKSDDKFRAGRVFLDAFFYPVAIYFLAKHFLVEERYFKWFIRILFIIAIYFSSMAIIEHIMGIDLLPTEVGIPEYSGWIRVNGPYIDPVSLAVNLSMCFFIVLYVSEAHLAKRKPNFFVILSCGGCLLLVAAALGATYHRASWAAVIIAGGIWIMLRRRGYMKLLITVILIISALYVSYDRLSSTYVYKDRIRNVETVESRFNVYDYVLHLYQKEPIFGIGFQNYYTRTEGTGIPSSTHNNFIAFLTETGIPGIIIVISIMIVIFIKAFQYYARSSRSPDKDFSRIFICIALCFYIPWLSVESGYLPEINKLFFAILGVMIGRSMQVDANEIRNMP